MARRLFFGFLLCLLVAPSLWAGEALSGSVTLEWDPNPEPDLVGYYVYRSEAPGGGYVRRNVIPHTQNQFTDTGLVAETTYYYVCSAVGVSGLESTFSNVVSVTIGAAAPPPTAVDDTVSLLEDEAALIDVLANDASPTNQPLELVSFTQPQRGAVFQASSRLRYVPPLNFHGTESFLYTVSDGVGGQASASVQITVLPVNDVPKARPDQVSFKGADSVSISPLTNDLDPDGDTLVVSSVSAQQGQASHDGTRVYYVAPQDFSGIDTLSYTVDDGHGASAASSIRVKVNLENHAPIPLDDWSWTLSGASVAIGLISNDTDPDQDLLQISGWSRPEGGSVSRISESTVRFTADTNFAGTAEFDYTVTDGELEATARVQVEVREMPSEDLVFPVKVSPQSGDPLLDDSMVGIALLNAESESREVTLRMLDVQGLFVAGRELDDLLPPGGQQAFLTSEVAEPASQAASLIVDAHGGRLEGLLIFVDGAAERLDALSARPVSGRRLYLQQLSCQPNRTMVVHLFNPNTVAAAVELQLFSAAGELGAQETAILPPLGRVRRSLCQLLDATEGIEEGYVRIESDEAVQAFALRADAQTFTTEAARPATRSAELIAPHFYFSRVDGDGSRLRVLNPSAAAEQVQVEAFGDDGGLLASTAFTLQPGEMFSRNLDELIGGDQVSGYLRLRVHTFLGDRPSLVSSIEFSGFGGRAATLVALAEIGLENTLFAHVAQERGRIFTGVALVNPLDQRVRVTLQAFSSTGNLAASREIELGAGQRLVEMLDSERLFGAEFEQLGGHLRVLAATPVVALAIFGSAQGEFLSGIEAQPLAGFRDF